MTAHVSADLLAQYAGGGLDVDDAGTWPVEAHLETCAECREQLAGLAPAPVRALLEDNLATLMVAAANGPRPAPRGRVRWFLHRWTTWSMLSWAVMTATATVAALLLDRAYPARPSLVLLLAPVAPLAGLAVAWSRRGDPAWETISGTSRAGVDLLLRRAVAVLAVVLVLLGLAGWALGASPALWLLPCVAFTAATLLLGGLIGVGRAAGALAGAWVLVVAAPALVAVRLPAVLHAESVPGWAAAAAILTVLALLRATERRGLTALR